MRIERISSNTLRYTYNSGKQMERTLPPEICDQEMAIYNELQGVTHNQAFVPTSPTLLNRGAPQPTLNNSQIIDNGPPLALPVMSFGEEHDHSGFKQAPPIYLPGGPPPGAMPPPPPPPPTFITNDNGPPLALPVMTFGQEHNLLKRAPLR